MFSADANVSFIQLLHENGTWGEFEADWRKQCSDAGEDFDSYAEATFTAVSDIVVKECRDAGVYALKVDGKHLAMCQLNRAQLPGYTGHVLRVRFITVSPELDLTDSPVHKYADVMIWLLLEVMKKSHSALTSRHIKFHLRSPEDRRFFSLLGSGLATADVFESIQMKGAWLHLSHK